MWRELPVRFRESLGVKFPRATRLIVGFQYRGVAERFLQELRERFHKFGLALHPDKTRLIEFGRFAAQSRRQRGQGKPETFDFLGFTHLCGQSRKSKRFHVWRKSVRRRLRAKLLVVKQALFRQRHLPIPEQGAWLRGVVQGYFQYHAVPGNIAALDAFRTQVLRHWRHALRRRSQRSRWPWARLGQLSDRWLPKPKILHPYPDARFRAKHPR